MQRRGVRIALIAYFAVLGAICVAYLIPTVLGVILVLFALTTLPFGYLIIYAPTLLLYSAAVAVVWFLAKRFPVWVRITASIVAVTTIGLVAPIFANQALWTQVEALKAEDKSLSRPVALSGTIAILAHQGDFKTDGGQILCGGLCQRLLYNGAVDRVILGVVPRGADEISSSTNLTGFTIEPRAQCQAEKVLADNWDDAPNPEEAASSRVEIRIASGDCLNKPISPPNLDEADFLLVDRELKQIRGGDDPSYIGARRLELLQRTPDGLASIDRRTAILVDPLVVPLLIIPGGRPNSLIVEGLDFVRSVVRVDLYDSKRPEQYRRLFGDAVRLPAVISGATPGEGPQIDQFRGLLAKALDDTNLEPAGFVIFDSYAGELETQGAAQSADVALLERLIADTRFNGFEQLAKSLPKLGPETATLAEPLMRRLSAASPSDWRTIEHVAAAIGALPPGAAGPIAPQLVSMLREHERAGSAARAIARISDRGTEYVPDFIAALGEPFGAEPLEGNDRMKVFGVLKGLCRLGIDAAAARSPVLTFLKEEYARDRNSTLVWLAAVTAIQLGGTEAEVRALLDETKWNRLVKTDKIMDSEVRTGICLR